MELNKNEMGSYVIEAKAFKDIAQIACKNVKNVYPAKEEFVTCKYSKKTGLEFVVSIKIKPGIDVVETCKEVQDVINENVLLMTGVDCENINIDIVGFVKEENKKSK